MRTPRWYRSSPVGSFQTVLLVFVAILAVDSLLALAELAAKGTGGAQLWSRIVAELPGRGRRLLTECCIIGVVWYMGSRAQHGELNALRSLGVSSFKICLSAALPVFLFAGAVLLAAEYGTVEPQSEPAREQWQRQQGLVLISEGCDKPLRWWHLDRAGAKSWGRAESACWRQGQWQMRDVTLWGDGGQSSVRHAEYSLAGDRLPPASKRLSPGQMRLGSLWRDQQLLPESRYRSGLLLEFWQRALTPVKIALLVLLATLLPLAMLRDSKPGMRLLAALGMAMGFHLLEALITTSGQGAGLPPLLTVAAPLLLLGGLSWVLFNRR